MTTTPLSCPDCAVVQHTLLERRGGACRVATMLRDGFGCGFSFELAESEAGERRLAEEPWLPTLLRHQAAGQLLHLHASGDWCALLQALAEARSGLNRPGPLVLTLHDCSLLSAGCPYPLDCPHFATGCTEPCPRNYPQPGERRALLLRLLRQLRPTVLCPSRWMKNMASTAWAPSGGELPVDLQVLPNGVAWPEQLPARSAARKELGVTPEAVVLVFAAHGGEQAVYKAGTQWRQLWRSIKAQIPQALGWFIGGQGSVRELEPGLTAWPYLPEEQLRRFLRAASVLVYPSLADNHPLLLLEAMAEGCPVAATAVGGIPEQIIPGRTGLLAAPGDPRELLQTVLTLLHRPGQARGLAVAAWEHGRRHFTRERMLADHARVYSRLLGQP